MTNFPLGHFIIIILPGMIALGLTRDPQQLIIILISLVIYYIGLRRFIVEVVEAEAKARREGKRQVKRIIRDGDVIDRGSHPTKD